MIRTVDKILGEANDPNTVIATETLGSGKVVVGAGNRGVRAVVLPASTLLYTDSQARLTGLRYDTPNKYVCSDETGALCLKDIPLVVSMDIDEMAAETLEGDVLESLTWYTPDNTAGLPEKIANWLSGSGKVYMVALYKEEGAVDRVLTWHFAPELDLIASKNVHVILTIETFSLDANSAEKPTLSPIVALKNYDKSVKVDLLDNSAVTTEAPSSIVIDKVISIESGVYSYISVPVQIPALIDSADSICYVRVSGCFIVEG